MIRLFKLNTMEQTEFEYIKTRYGVKADMHRIVIFEGRRGLIVADRGNYIGVNFDDEEPGLIRNCHPTYNIEYLDEFGKPRKVKNQRSKERYAYYREVADCYDSFGHFLRTNSKNQTI